VVNDDAAFNLTVPDGWDVYDGPTGLVVLRPIRDIGGFRTNVLVTHAAADESFTLAGLMAEAAGHLGTRPSAVVHAEDRAGNDDFASMVRLASFDAPAPFGADPWRLVQLHALYLAESGGDSRAVLEIIATCPFDELDAHAGAWHDLLASVVLARCPTLPA
jgi:hypothetical protein